MPRFVQSDEYGFSSPGEKWIIVEYTGKEWRPWLDCLHAKTDLGLPYSHR